MKIALTIAGSDPTGGAGVQADLKVFKSLKVYGLSIITALTAQSTREVCDIHDPSGDFLSRQFDVLLGDMLPDAVKTGMVYSEEIVSVVYEKVKQYSLKNIVIDPVTVSSSGVPLVKDNVLESMKQHLFPLAKVVTPNVYEATLITGINFQDEEGMKKAAVSLKELGPDAVIITGGHFEGRALDLFFDGKDFLFLENEKLEGKYHGTGCVFSSVVTAGLALGYEAGEAAVKAKDFVLDAMKNAVRIGKGMKILSF